MDNGDIVRRYRTLSTEDRVTFDRWLRAGAGVGIIIAGGLIAMALAGANSAAPRDARNNHNVADAVASNKDANPTMAESATVVSPLCVEVDLRLITLIEAHGEVQDVAAHVLAQAFFTVVEARKACNRGQVERALNLYESIPLPPVTSLRQ